VQEILIRTATKNSAGDGDWANNGAGFHFNHKYGAGIVNARAAVTAALSWTNLGPRVRAASVQTSLALAIPDNNTGGVTRTFALAAPNLRVEHVALTVNATHAYRGDLAITLVSPAGTVSRLAERHADSGDHYANWRFTSVRHWGENSQGTWTVRVADGRSGTAGTLNSLQLEIFGTAGSNQPPAIAAIGDRSVVVSNTLQFAVTATESDGDSVTLTNGVLPSGASFVVTNGTGGASGVFAFTPGAAHLLVVLFKRLRQKKMDDPTDVGDVNAHSKRTRGKHYVDIPFCETNQCLIFFRHRQIGIEWRAPEALFTKSLRKGPCSPCFVLLKMRVDDELFASMHFEKFFQRRHLGITGIENAKREVNVRS